MQDRINQKMKYIPLKDKAWWPLARLEYIYEILLRKRITKQVFEARKKPRKIRPRKSYIEEMKKTASIRNIKWEELRKSALEMKRCLIT